MVVLLVLVGVLHVSSMTQVSVLSEATVGLDDLVDANAFEDGSTMVVAAGGEREATNIHRVRVAGNLGLVKIWETSSFCIRLSYI